MASHGNPAGPGTLHIGLLGPLELQQAGRAISLPRRRRSLLALLALRPGTVVTTDQLVEGLWGKGSPMTAVRTLHAHIAKLGAAFTQFEHERPIQRREPGYLLNDAAEVDSTRFRELASAGLRHSAEGRFAEAARALETGLDLWRGPALADCEIHDWAAAEVDFLQGLRFDAQEALISTRLAAGVPGNQTGEIERLIAAHPFRERLWELLIVALQLGGRSADALDAYQRARRLLLDELGLEPGEGLRHVESGVLQGVTDALTLLRVLPSPVTGPLTTSARAVPEQVDPLIGRDTEITELATLLSRERLVTLTGLGGAGKSRLAAAAARAAEPDFTAVAFVDLAGVEPGGSVTGPVAAALGVQVQADEDVVRRLAERITDDRILIVLDNCEHVVSEAAPLVYDLLTRCPRLHVLATSQQALRLTCETTRPVPPLRSPRPYLVRSAADLAGYPAVELFAERARLGVIAALPPADAQAVAMICARCEGLPLAIELAAARARLLSLPEIARKLRKPYAVLVDGPRGTRPQHRTLRTTVDWAYRLLPAEDRHALRRLSVFASTFDLHATAAVHPDSPPLDVVSGLMDRSLLTAEHTAAGTRYRMLTTIRAHASEQLLTRPAEHAEARRAHATYFLHRALELEDRLRGSDFEWLATLVDELHDDVRTAITWLIDHEPANALSLTSALWRYHHLRGRYSEGRAWLSSAIAAADGLAGAGIRAKALWSAARLASLECDYDEATPLARKALALAEAVDDTTVIALAHSLLGAIARERGDYAAALDLSRQSFQAALRCGDRWTAGNALQLRGFASWLSGDHGSAVAASSEAASILGVTGDRERLGWCELDLGAAALYSGERPEAARHLRKALLLFFEIRFKEGIAWAENLLALLDLDRDRHHEAVRRLTTSLRLHHELSDRWRQASVLESLAAALVALEEGRLAARMLDTAEQIRTVIGTPVPPCERALLERTRLGVDRLLGGKRHGATAEGGSSTVGELLAQVHAVMARLAAGSVPAGREPQAG